jgi:hypothetical protein
MIHFRSKAIANSAIEFAVHALTCLHIVLPVILVTILGRNFIPILELSNSFYKNNELDYRRLPVGVWGTYTIRIILL